MLDDKWYWGNEKWWVKALRFLNLLEPDRAVISVTKLSAWITLANSIHMPESWGAHVLTGLAWLKCEHRRRVQSKK